MAVKIDHQIARLQTRFFRSTAVAVRFERNNQHSGLNRQLIIPDNTSRYRHVLSGNADVTPSDLAVANQTTRDKLRGIDRRRKADSLGRQYGGRVYPDDV